MLQDMETIVDDIGSGEELLHQNGKAGVHLASDRLQRSTYSEVLEALEFGAKIALRCTVTHRKRCL